MTKEFQKAFDQVELSPQADGRIRSALMACQQDNAVSPLPTGRTAKRTVRFLLIAAAVALLGTVTALAVVNRGILEITRADPDTYDHETLSVEEGSGGDYIVIYRATGEIPDQTGVWYPEILPDNFEELSVTRGRKSSSVVFGYGEINRMTLMYQVAGLDSYITIPDSNSEYRLERRTVSVNGVEGVLFTDHYEDIPDVQSSVLIWLYPETGIGFSLGCWSYDPIDLVQIAESVTLRQPEP